MTRVQRELDASERGRKRCNAPNTPPEPRRRQRDCILLGYFGLIREFPLGDILVRKYLGRSSLNQHIGTQTSYANSNSVVEGTD